MEPDPPAGRLRRLAEVLRRTDANPALLRAAQAGRDLLPGDPQFGDQLSTAERRPSQIIARHLAEMGKRPSASRQLGLTALQLWQAVSESAGRGHGTQDVAILFTDLGDFSDWALQVGDEVALELLRQVASAVEPAIAQHGGRVVKRLGDGHMAVFPDPQTAVEAACDVQARMESVEVDGHRPALRAGVHVGTPRKMAADYLGVDVNVAARVAAAADGGEVLVSGAALAGVDTDAFEAKRRRRFKAKGAPRELEVYAVSRR